MTKVEISERVRPKELPTRNNVRNDLSSHCRTSQAVCRVDLLFGSLAGGAGSRFLRKYVRGQLKYDGTRAETRFRLSAKRTSQFKSAGASVQSTAGSRGVRISGSNAGYTMFRGSVKGTGYPLHSPVSPSLPLPVSPCAITFQLESIGKNRRLHITEYCNHVTSVFTVKLPITNMEPAGYPETLVSNKLHGATPKTEDENFQTK